LGPLLALVVLVAVLVRVAAGDAAEQAPGHVAHDVAEHAAVRPVAGVPVGAGLFAAAGGAALGALLAPLRAGEVAPGALVPVRGVGLAERAAQRAGERLDGPAGRVAVARPLLAAVGARVGATVGARAAARGGEDVRGARAVRVGRGGGADVAAPLVAVLAAGAGDRVALVGRLVLLVVVLLGRVRLALDHRLDALDDRGRLVLVLRERRAQRLLHAVAQVGERLGRVVALLAAHLALRLELPQRLLVVGRRRGGGALLERALDRVELGLRLGQLRRALGQRPERLELRHQGGALLLQQRLALLERLDRRRLLRTAVRREGEPARLGLRDRVELAADRRENDLRLVGPHVGVHRRLVGRLRGQRGGRGGDDVLGDEVAGAARDQARDRHARDGAAPHGRDGVPALGGGPRSEEHTSELQSREKSRMPSSA